MHHKRHEQGGPGDNIGMNVKGLDKQNMPRTGDVMVYKKDTSLGACANFNAQIQVLDIPGEIKACRREGAVLWADGVAECCFHVQEGRLVRSAFCAFSRCLQIGYSPIGFVRCGRAACRVSKILWKIGKETGGKKVREWCAWFSLSFEWGVRVHCFSDVRLLLRRWRSRTR